MLTNDIRVVGLNSNGKVTAEDLTCTICCSIFVEPVVLPCGHGFCFGCFNGVVAFNSLVCPCCRKRFGNWLRKANRDQTLIDQSLWKFIQTNFSEEVGKENLHPPAPSNDSTDHPVTVVGEAKIRTTCTNAPPISADAATKFDATPTSTTAPALTADKRTIVPHLSQPGEIRKEFEAQLESFRKEQEKERENELIATTEFIVKLLEKELITVKQNERSDRSPSTSNENMLVANPGHTPYTINSTKTLNNTNSIPTASQTASSSTAAFLAQPTKCSLMKTLAVRLNRGTDILKQSVQKAIIAKIPQNFLSGVTNREVLTIPPTKTHREPNNSVNSTDSLRLEMCHFKPIRTAPTTPSKKRNDELLRTPKAKRLGKLQLDDLHKDKFEIQPSPLQKILQQSPRKSAFCLVVTPPSQQGPSTSSQTSHHNIDASNTCDKERVGQKNPVVLIRRINKSRSKTKNLVNTIGSNIKEGFSQQNGLLSELIKEQKRCEERLQQEKLDFEIAKKLESELNAIKPIVERPTLRRRIKSNDDNDAVELEKAPPAKRCRRTCGRILSFKETQPDVVPAPNKKGSSDKMAQIKSLKNSNVSNLRRSNRNCKPTRRYIV